MSTEQAAQAERELREREIVLLMRQDYDEYETELRDLRSAIVDQTTDGGAVEAALQHIDRLYAEHVSGSRSSVIVHEDQQAFLHISNLVLARARNQVMAKPGAISVDSFVGALRDSADKQGSGAQLLEHMGELLVRGGGTAVLPTAMPELAEAERRKGHSGPREQMQSVRNAAQPTDITDGNLDSDDLAQQMVMQTIERALRELEAANNFEPVLLYELCLQQKSFAETMENFFLVSVLVSMGRFWLAPNERGLPVVGTAVNQRAYLESHGRGAEVAQLGEHKGERHQFNFNMNYGLWLKLRELYPDEEDPEQPSSIIPRRREYDDYDMQGRLRTSSPQPGSSRSSSSRASSVQASSARPGSARPGSARPGSAELTPARLATPPAP